MMTGKRLKEAKEAYNDLCEWVKSENHPAQAIGRHPYEINCYKARENEFWVNVYDIIATQIYNNNGEWVVNPYIEIVDPDTNDWDGECYDARNI